VLRNTEEIGCSTTLLGGSVLPKSKNVVVVQPSNGQKKGVKQVRLGGDYIRSWFEQNSKSDSAAAADTLQDHSSVLRNTEDVRFSFTPFDTELLHQFSDGTCYDADNVTATDSLQDDRSVLEFIEEVGCRMYIQEITMVHRGRKRALSHENCRYAEV
jgi:hypothetical protein